ncbi:MAG: DpnI domain-containing protein [Thermoplasmatales archaeon]
MDLDLSSYFSEVVREYKSPSQIARNVTEKWARDNLYCPKCGSPLNQYKNNTEVYDFYCDHADQEFLIMPSPVEDFQLKSTKYFPHNNFPRNIVGSGYDAAIRKLNRGEFPSLILLHYERKREEVRDGLLVHRLAIPQSCIKPRKPLTESARRSGWRGYEISMFGIPHIGKIQIIEDARVVPKKTVMTKWRSVENILESTPSERDWITEILIILEKLPFLFTLQDAYSYETYLRNLHPHNHHIREKIRQQLQFLRDKGYLKFMGNGKYQKSAT